MLGRLAEVIIQKSHTTDAPHIGTVEYVYSTAGFMLQRRQTCFLNRTKAVFGNISSYAFLLKSRV